MSLARRVSFEELIARAHVYGITRAREEPKLTREAHSQAFQGDRMRLADPLGRQPEERAADCGLMLCCEKGAGGRRVINAMGNERVEPGVARFDGEHSSHRDRRGHPSDLQSEQLGAKADLRLASPIKQASNGRSW